MRPSKLLVSLSLTTLIVLIQSALAQNSYLNEPGIPEFTTSFPVEHGFINLANGNLHIEIPIADYPQRGNIKVLHARLVYDSRFWTVYTDQVQGTLMWRPNGIPPVGVNIGGGFRLITDGESGNTSFSQSSRVDCYITDAGGVQHPQYLTTYSNFTYQEPNGTKHGGGSAFKLYYNPSNCPGQQTTPSGTVISRGYKFVVTNANGSISTSVFAPDGTQVAIPGASLGSAMVQDTNGNFFSAAAGQNVTYRNVIDTLGRTPVVTTFSGSQVFLDYLCVPATAGCNASNGNRARVTINTTAPNWTTQFNQSGVNEYSGPGSALTSIVFPDGSQYQFQQDSYGMITSMTLPTGGQISYGYTNETDYQGNVNRWVTSGTLDGNTWNFNVVPVLGGCTATPCTQQVTVTTPPYNDGTTTTGDSHVYTFAVLGSTAWVNQIQYFRGPASGTPVLTKTVDYGSPGACPAAAGYVDAASVPIRETLIWPNGSGTLSKKVEYCYDSYVNVTVRKMWDYQANSGFAANPDRELDTSYVTDPSYIGANLIRLPLTTTTLSPGGVQMAQTTYAYDAGTPQPSHVTTNLNIPTTPRGNLTSVSRWLNTGGTVTTSTAWYDSGEVYQAKDALLNTTATYTYDSTGAYPSQVCNAKSQCSYGAYDFNTGLLTTFTDANGTSLGDALHTTTHAYDSMLRPLCTNFPDGGQTCAGYPDPNHVTKQTKVTSALADASTTVFDDLGRISQTQHTLPNGVAKVDTTYDPVGGVATLSNPYLATTDPTYGVTQSFHDALSRTVETIKQDSSVSSAAYSVITSGVNGACVTTTDEAGKQRTVCHNGFGETVQVLEPGDAFAGTAASGGLNISGTLQTKSAVPATSATGSFTVSGSEQSKSGIGAYSATPGSGSVTINGGEQSVVDTSNCNLVNHIWVCTTIWDHGSVALTVNGVPGSCSYSKTLNTSSAAMASCLAGAITNATNSPVTATASGSTISITARTSGASTNYSFSVSSSYDTFDFSGPSYTGSPASGNLSGGQDAYAGSTTYDSGTCTVSVNGTSYQQGFGQGDTTSTIASNLASVIGGGSLVSATASGATISLTAKTAGTAGNYSLSGGNCSYNTSTFSSPSFAVNASGSAMTGGTNGSPAVADAGTVQISIGGSPSYSATANYGNGTGQDSTATAVAADLVAKIQAQLPSSNPPFTLSANGAGININWASVGSAGNVAVTTTSTTTQTSNFSTPSFASCAISANPQNCSTALSGGQDAYSPGIAHPFVTLYNYDGLGNLTCVEQHGDAATGAGCSASASSDATSPWRVRRFAYDSLSRLLSSSNPEANTAVVNATPTRVNTTYSYDANGNLLQKTGPAPNQLGTATQTISYCYDALNRATGRAYSAQTCTNGQLPAGTAVVSYTYDQGTNAIGHLASLSDQAGSGSYSYDNMGRILSEQRTLNGLPSPSTKNLAYTYNLDGSLQTLTYPSGAVVTYTPWNNGTNAVSSPSDAKDNGHGINYATSATYGPDLSLTGFVSGAAGSFAGITNSFTFDKRLQPVNMAAASPSQTVFSLNYDFHLGAGDNGDVFGITNNKDTTRNQTFTYDALNRLTSARNAGTDCSQKVVNPNQTKFWGNNYGYDAWGNLLSKSVTKCNAEYLNVTTLADNQLSGYGYDAAGNMTNDPTDGVVATYDPENRIATATKNGITTTYTYDDDGNRVEKSNGTTGTLYWHMTPGILAESDLAGNLQSEYVFFDGERVARKDFPSNAVSYYFSDHLKTTDIVTDAQGNIKNESDFYPWGGELSFISSDSNHYKFTAKERDAETNLDYFGARYYSNGLGRFITPDWSATPVPVPYADLTDPQSLNQYSYVRNIPTVKVDADGHDGCCDTDVEVDMEMVKQTLNQLKPLAPALSNPVVALAVVDIVGIAIIGHELAYPSTTVGQSDAEERAAIEQAKRNREQQQAQSQGQTDQQKKAEPEPQASSGNAGRRTGGGRNAPKVNQDRRQSAANKLADLRKQRDELQRKPNKTPEDKAKLDSLNKAINREIDRMRESEEHSRKEKH